MTDHPQDDSYLTDHDLGDPCDDQLRGLGHRCAELEQDCADLQHQYVVLQAQRDTWQTERATLDQEIRELRDAIAREQHRRAFLADRMLVLVHAMRDMMLAYRMLQDMIPYVFWWRRTQFIKSMRALPDPDAIESLIAPYDSIR